MRVHVFASLKDHFEKEFELDATFENTAQLRNYLIDIKPDLKSILYSCRFAVDEEFVDLHYKLGSNDTIFIIPPSSGG